MRELRVARPGRGPWAASAPAGARSRSGRRSSRSGTARRAASCGPRTRAARARRAGARPAARPRRRAPSRACGSSARAARRGAARAAGRRRPRRRSRAAASSARCRSLAASGVVLILGNVDRRRPPELIARASAMSRASRPGLVLGAPECKGDAHVAAQLVVAAERNLGTAVKQGLRHPARRHAQAATAAHPPAPHAPEGLSVEFRAVKAAVCHGFGEPLVVEDIDLAPPGPGRGAGARRPPARSATATSPTPRAPGAGACPPSTATRRRASSRRWAARRAASRPGDHVVVTLVRSCGTCHVCRRGQPALCETAFRAGRAQPAACARRRRDRPGPAHRGLRRAGARPPLPGRPGPARAAARSRLPAGLRRRHRLRRGASTRRRSRPATAWP